MNYTGIFIGRVTQTQKYEYKKQVKYRVFERPMLYHKLCILVLGAVIRLCFHHFTIVFRQDI